MDYSVPTPTEFVKNGVRYQIRPLNVIEQWHLNRKLAPLLPPLLPIMLKLARDESLKPVDDETAKAPIDVEGLIPILGPFADAIATISNEASEEIINTCLSAIKRYVPPSTWVPVWSAGAKVSTFSEFNSLHTALPFVVEVVTNALGPFIQGLLTQQASPGKPMIEG